jgi:protein-S-isoprenylcysteine O-methyltransferase Ste14
MYKSPDSARQGGQIRGGLQMLQELLFRVLFLLVYIIFGGTRIYYRTRRRGPKNAETEKRRSTAQVGGCAGIVLSIGILGMLISMILYLLIPLQVQWFPLPLPSMVRWAGVILGFSTIPFLVWIHRTLGRYYSAILETKKEHALVTIGPYSRIRHPMYTVFMLFTLSTALMTANLLVAVFAAIIITMFFPLSKKEERMLIDRFGEEYRNYMKRTGRFLPRMRQHKSNAADPVRGEYRSSP